MGSDAERAEILRTLETLEDFVSARPRLIAMLNQMLPDKSPPGEYEWAAPAGVCRITSPQIRTFGELQRRAEILCQVVEIGLASEGVNAQLRQGPS